jgi:hypothetical protein
MEINRFDKVQGVVVDADVVEGRFVVLGTHSETYDFGSNEELLGAHVPQSTEEGKRAKYIVTWPVSNSPTPMYQTNPAYTFALRQGGWDQAKNTPFTTKVYTTYPGYMDGETIPSGSLALAFTEGVFTIPSGSYVYDANIIVKGAALVVCNTADDTAAYAGKVKYTASLAVGVIGFTEYYDLTTGKLTVRVE